MANPVINKIINCCDPRSELITIHGENFANTGLFVWYPADVTVDNTLLNLINATDVSAKKQLILDFITNSRAVPALPAADNNTSKWLNYGTPYSPGWPYLRYIDSQTIQVYQHLGVGHGSGSKIRTYPTYVQNSSGVSNVWMLNAPKSFFTEWTVRPSWRKYRRHDTIAIVGDNLSNELIGSRSALNYIGSPGTPGSVWLQLVGNDANPVYQAEVINQQFNNSDNYAGFTNVVYFRGRVLPTTSSTVYQDIPEGTYHVYTSQDTHAWGVCYHGQLTFDESAYTFNDVDASNFTYNSNSYSMSPSNSGSANSKALLAATFQACTLTNADSNHYRPRVLIPPGTYKIDRRLALPDDVAIHAYIDGTVNIISDPDVDFSILTFDPNWTSFPAIPAISEVTSTRYYKPAGPISTSGVTITSVTNASPYVVTTSTAHGFGSNGANGKVYITGVTGHGGNPNGIWFYTILSSTTFSLAYPQNNSNTEAMGSGAGSGGTALNLDNWTSAWDTVIGDEGWLWATKGNWIKGLNVISTRSLNPAKRPIPSLLCLFDKNPAGDPTTTGNNSLENCTWYNAQIESSTTSTSIWGDNHSLVRFNAVSGTSCSGTVYGVTYPGTRTGYHFNNELINLKSYATFGVYTAPNANPCRTWFDNIEFSAPGGGLFGIAGNMLHTESFLRSIKNKNVCRGLSTVNNQNPQYRTIIHDYCAENTGHNYGGGEQLVWEGGGTLCTSVTYNSGTPSVTFTPASSISVRPNMHIMIISGPGKGQYRKIVAVSGSSPYTVTLDSAFIGTINNSTSIMSIGNYTVECKAIRTCITNSAKAFYFYAGTLDCRIAGGKFDSVNNCVMMTMRMYSGDVTPHYFNRFDFMEVFNSSAVFGTEVFLDPSNSPYVGIAAGGSIYFFNNELVNPRNFLCVLNGLNGNLFTPTGSWNHIINGLTICNDKYDIDAAFAHKTSGSVSVGQVYAVPRNLAHNPWSFPTPLKIQGLSALNVSICGLTASSDPTNNYHRNIWGDDTTINYTHESTTRTVYVPSGYTAANNGIGNATDDGTTPLTSYEIRGDLGVISTTITNQLATIDTNVDAANSTLATLSTTIDTIDTNTSNIVLDLDTINTIDTNVDTVISTLGTMTTTLNTVNSTTGSTNTTVNTINTNVNTANSSLSTMTTTLNTVNSTTGSTNTTVGTINTTVSTINTNVNTANSTLGTINTNVNTANSTLGTMSTTLGTVNTNTAATNVTVGTINTNVNTANSTLGTMTTTLGTINSNTTNISSDLDTIDTNVNALAITTSNMNTTVGNIFTIADQINFVDGNVVSTLNGETVVLSSNGLSEIDITAPTSTPNNIVDLISFVYHRLYGKVIYDKGNGLLSVYVPSTLNPVAQQVVTDNSNISSTGAAVFE